MYHLVLDSNGLFPSLKEAIRAAPRKGCWRIYKDGVLVTSKVRADSLTVQQRG